MKTRKIVLLIFLCFASCKKVISQHDEGLKNSILKQIKLIEYESENEIMDEVKYNKNDKIFFIEVIKNLRYNNLTIFYSYSNRMEENIQYKMFIESNNKLFFIVHEVNKYDQSKKTVLNLQRDSIYFHDDKILDIIHKKNPSKEEILSKEKEILAIKREIDSILDN